MNRHASLLSLILLFACSAFAANIEPPRQWKSVLPTKGAKVLPRPVFTNPYNIPRGWVMTNMVITAPCDGFVYCASDNTGGWNSLPYWIYKGETISFPMEKWNAWFLVKFVARYPELPVSDPKQLHPGTGRGKP